MRKLIDGKAGTKWESKDGQSKMKTNLRNKKLMDDGEEGQRWKTTVGEGGVKI